MKKSMSGLMAGLAALGVATAMSAPAQADWSGLYGGMNEGYAWGSVDWQYRNPADATGALSQSPSGFALGGHVGFQHQFVGSGIVLGVEGAYSGGYADKIDARGTDTPAFAATFDAYTRINSIFTIGPRLGYAPSSKWLLFATGGFASAQFLTTDSLRATGVENFPSASRNSGWYVGGGVEYAMTTNWIVGLEYQHMQFDTHCQYRCDLATPVFGGTRDISGDFDVVRARFSYKLGRPAPAAEPMK